MKKNQINSLVLLLGFFLLVPTMAFSRDSCDKKGHGQNWGERHEQKMEQLNLSEKQKQQIKAIDDKYATQKKELKEKMKSAHEALRAAFKANASNDDLRAKFKSVQDLKSQKSELRFEKRLEVRAVLTAEQRQKLSEAYKHHKDK